MLWQVAIIGKENDSVKSFSFRDRSFVRTINSAKFCWLLATRADLLNTAKFFQTFFTSPSESSKIFSFSKFSNNI